MKYLVIKLFVVVLSLFLMLGCSTAGTAQTEIVVSEDLPWSERMAQSIMKSNPEPWMIEFMERPVWSYPQGLVLHAFEKLWKQTGNKIYLDYIEEYANSMIHEDGTIETYRMETFNIDMIKAGKILFNLHELTGNAKYEKAIMLLKYQLEWQPRTTEGGFWHKLRYPWQMWLDGAYMAAPFMAQYASVYGEDKWFEEAVRQLVLMESKTRDANTGLLYHGWDESCIQKWADPQTGLSANFWGRAMGWYAMAVVDVLGFLPEDYPGRQSVVEILERLAKAVVDYQDAETGLWYQVLDQGNREGNYLEASASCMFVFALASGANQGILGPEYLSAAHKGFDGILENLIEVAPDGELFLHEVCAVAGLGASDRRDGSYEYYISEPKRTNDPKGTGPFVKAALELKR